MKILIGFVLDLSHSGIDKYLLGVNEILNENGVFPDYLTSEYSEYTEEYFKKKNSRVFSVPSLKNPFGQIKKIREIIRRENYDAVYLNISEPLNILALYAAKQEKVKRIIVHSHSSGIDRDNPVSRIVRSIINSVARPFVKKWATEFFSCSDTASDWMYGKEFSKSTIIYNSVDLEKFMFSEQKREEKRAELGLQNRFTVLLVGNMCYQKNVFFAVDVFKKVLEKIPDAVFLIVGEGKDLNKLKEYSGNTESVKFLGVRNDIPEIMSCSDVFMLPSRFEGLGIVYIESQASGLYTLISENAPKISQISENSEFLPIKNPDLWAEKIISRKGVSRENLRFLPIASKYGKNHQKEQIEKLILRK